VAYSRGVGGLDDHVLCEIRRELPHVWPICAGWLAAAGTTLDFVAGLSIRVYLVEKFTSRPSQTEDFRLIRLKLSPNTVSEAQDFVSYTVWLE
jgi:hypothetical protein